MPALSQTLAVQGIGDLLHSLSEIPRANIGKCLWGTVFDTVFALL